MMAMRATAHEGYYGDAQKSDGALYCHTDSVRLRRWALMASGGFVTHVHHDANGLCSWVTVATGSKLWTYFRCKHNDPEQVSAARLALAEFDRASDISMLEEHFELGTVLLTPGVVLQVRLPSPKTTS